MSAQLCIQVYSDLRHAFQEVTFFEAEEWNEESEKQLLLKMQDLFCVVRNCGKRAEIRINLDVRDAEEVMFLLRKRMSNRVEINHQKLSLREVEVLGLIMQGHTNHEIADKLFICYETVKSHRKNILLKTGAKNTAALVNHYHQTFFEK